MLFSANSEVATKSSENEKTKGDGKTWNVLDDNYLLEAKLKDWEEPEPEAENDFEFE